MIDAVYIREGHDGREVDRQAQTVRAYLVANGIHVPDQYWCYADPPEEGAEGRAGFERLLELVLARKVGRVFVDTRGEFAGTPSPRWIAFIHVLKAFGARLVSVEDGDLT